MKLFITGGAGFIGSYVVQQALAVGHTVTALRLPGESPKIPLSIQPRWVDGSLADDWTAELRGVEGIIHLAAVGVSPQQATWEQLFRVNVLQSMQLMSAAVAGGVKRFIICGSCFEYGLSGEKYDFIPVAAPLKPANAYAASKAAATMAALALGVEHKVELAVLRPFHVFGEGQHPSNFWPSLKKAALAGEDFPMTLGEQMRDFVSVERLAAFFVGAVSRTDLQPGMPVIENLGSGQPQTLRAFAEHWWQHWGAKGQLLPGAIPYRANEVMRYVPLIPS